MKLNFLSQWGRYIFEQYFRSCCVHSNFRMTNIRILNRKRLSRSKTCKYLIWFIFVGENPLADDQSNHDINSIAGVLKLYFRGLENPIFPKERFNDLISCVSKLNLFLSCVLNGHFNEWNCIICSDISILQQLYIGQLTAIIVIYVHPF